MLCCFPGPVVQSKSRAASPLSGEDCMSGECCVVCQVRWFRVSPSRPRLSPARTVCQGSVCCAPGPVVQSESSAASPLSGEDCMSGECCVVCQVRWFRVSPARPCLSPARTVCQGSVCCAPGPVVQSESIAASPLSGEDCMSGECCVVRQVRWFRVSPVRPRLSPARTECQGSVVLCARSGGSG